MGSSEIVWGLIGATVGGVGGYLSEQQGGGGEPSSVDWGKVGAWSAAGGAVGGGAAFAANQAKTKPPPPPPNPGVFRGTWALQQISTIAQAAAPSTVAALATPGLHGYSARMLWADIYGTGPTYPVFTAAAAVARTAQVHIGPRFISGIHTPPAVMQHCNTFVVTKPTSHPVNAPAPLPWGQGSTPTNFVPNAAFEQAFDAEASALFTWAHAHGAPVVHLPWFSALWSEIYMGSEMAHSPGWSYTNWLTGHQRLAQIAKKYAGNGVAVEFPLSGYCELVPQSTMIHDVMAMLVGVFGRNSADCYVQFNNMTDAPGFLSIPDLLHGRQMLSPTDYDWDAVYRTLAGQGDRTVEIYVASFSPSLPHHAALLSNVSRFQPA